MCVSVHARMCINECVCVYICVYACVVSGDILRALMHVYTDMHICVCVLLSSLFISPLAGGKRPCGGAVCGGAAASDEGGQWTVCTPRDEELSRQLDMYAQLQIKAAKRSHRDFSPLTPPALYSSPH